jgi:predicted ATPase
MRILTLKSEGFRSLKDSIWNPGQLNILIGPNGSGKSNLLRLLELIAISAKGGMGKYIQYLGGMEPLVWDGRAGRIRFEVKFSPLEEQQDTERDSVTYMLELARLGSFSSYRVEEEQLANYAKVKQGVRGEPFKFLERNQQYGVMFDEQERRLVAQAENTPTEETLLSSATNPFAVNRHISTFQRLLAGWTIYHDIHVDRDAPMRKPAITRYEKRLDADGQNLVSVLHTLYSEDQEFSDNLDDAMRAAFGNDFDGLAFPPASDQKTQLRLKWKSLKRGQSAAELSEGTLRFLLLLTILTSPDLPQLIAIDEPELGLHPAMLPIIAEYAVAASKHSQVILTTHSPAFLDAFGGEKPTVTVVQLENGQTSLKVVDEDILSYWLKEYSLGRLMSSGELEAL